MLPDLIRHASLNMSSADVLRFLGRKLHPSLRAQVTTDTRGRAEGWRVKHRMARNSVKVYDKVSVLRVETTINNPREFRVLRVLTDEAGRRERRWCPINKGDRALFRAVLAGGHAISGFRNADLMQRLYPRPPADTAEAHRRCARVSRLIAKLRGHGLVAKVPRARLYRPTRHGYRVMTAAIALHDDRFPELYNAAA